MRRPQISLKTLLWLILVVACFFAGIHFERERHRSEDQAAALDKRRFQRAAALARVSQRMALIAAERDLQQQQIAAEEEARARINRELFFQEQKVDELMARFNALMAEGDAEAKAAPAEQIESSATNQPLILPPLRPLLPYDGWRSLKTSAD